MLYAFVIIVHLTACLILIAAILLQAGRGGGLSETFGSDSQKTLFGAKANVFLTRATVTAACLFLVTSLLLGVLTSRRGKSIIALQGNTAQQPQNPGPRTPSSEPHAQRSEDIPYIPPPVPPQPENVKRDSEDAALLEPESMTIDEPGGPSLD